MTTLEYITDLRAENETMKSERSFANEGMRTIRAENAKLRAALAEIAPKIGSMLGRLGVSFPKDAEILPAIRAALAGKGAE